MVDKEPSDVPYFHEAFINLPKLTFDELGQWYGRWRFGNLLHAGVYN